MSLDIFPYDCYIMSDCTKGTSGRCLYFWGYSRTINTEPTKLTYIDSQTDEGHFKPGETVYNMFQLDYLGFRSNNVPAIVDKFADHFYSTRIDPENIVYLSNKGPSCWLRVDTRWPDGRWYFLFPQYDPDNRRVERRKEVYDSWDPTIL